MHIHGLKPATICKWIGAAVHGPRKPANKKKFYHESVLPSIVSMTSFARVCARVEVTVGNTL